jgi:hypothetical protein
VVIVNSIDSERTSRVTIDNKDAALMYFLLNAVLKQPAKADKMPSNTASFKSLNKNNIIYKNACKI